MIVDTVKRLYNKYSELIRYVFFGALTTGVSLAVYYLCVMTVLDPNKALQLQIANVISWVASVTFAYFTNRKYVFESTSENKLREAVSFFLARGSTLLIDMAAMFIMVSWFGWNDKIAKLITQVIVLVSNYLLSKFIVFRNKK